MSNSNYPDAEEFVARAGFGPKAAGRVYAAVFWLNALLLAGGIVGIYFGFFGPRLKTSKPFGWVEISGTVDSSQVARPAVGSQASQGVEVIFRYDFSGREYSFRQTIELASNVGSSQARNLVSHRYAPGRRVPCWVNPKNPSEASVNLRVATDQPPALSRIGPLLLVIVGLVGMFRSQAASSRVQTAPAPLPVRRWPRALVQGPGAWSRAAPEFDAVPAPLEETVRSRTFKPWPAYWARLVFILAGMGVLTGIAFMVIPSGGLGGVAWSEGWDYWPLRVGLGAVSLLLLALCGYFLLALFNPRPWFQVNTRNLMPGQTLEIEWRIRGRAARLQRLRFYLEGMETAYYRRGTDWAMKRQVLDRFVITEAVDADLIRAGRTSLRIPTDLIPSFEAEHNRIDWALRLQVEIPRWPDIKESMPVVLLPPGATAEAPALGN